MAGTIEIIELRTGAHLRAEMAVDVRSGLSARPKTLPPKYFYDERGSQLFDEITRLPEYYLTRAETGLLEQHAREIVEELSPRDLIEIGGGFSRKSELLLGALDDGARYTSLDVSGDALKGALERLSARFPALDFMGVVGDFHTDLQEIPRAGTRLVAFLGSTIGNLEVDERLAFFGEVRRMLARDDRFLLGVDLVKPAERLQAAYDDAAGITAEFNLNVLRVLNRELDGNVPLDAFRHEALFDAERERIEMRLVAEKPVSARLNAIDLEVSFEAGERVLTEISCKFRHTTLEQALGRAGLVVERWIEDEPGDFALLVAAPAGTVSGLEAAETVD